MHVSLLPSANSWPVQGSGESRILGLATNHVNAQTAETSSALNLVLCYSMHTGWENLVSAEAGTVPGSLGPFLVYFAASPPMHSHS